MGSRSVFEEIEKNIDKIDIDEKSKQELFDQILRLKSEKVNLMITGATGCGKSSTINAMFQTEVAKVGVGVDPETMDITKYDLGNLVLWDTPGLGDGKEKDIKHSKSIVKILQDIDSDGSPVIDMVLVILDGSSRDLGTSYELINKVIIPTIGADAKDRVLVAINQADTAMKGRNWDYENNRPEAKLVDFLNDKVNSVRSRIKEATGVDIDPICYSAGYKEDGDSQRPWNLSKLLYFIVKNTPEKKRLSYIDNISKDTEVWSDDDQLENYREETKKSFTEVAASVTKNISAGAAAGAAIGSAIPVVGTAVGAIIGGAIGFFCSFF